MDLTFQVPMQYCFLQHQTLFLSPVTSTAGYSFCFGSIPSFFLELFLHWSPIAYWASSDLGISSFSILSFCLFILFMGFSRQEYWSGFPFRSSVDHILSDISTMPRPSSIAPQAWLSFIELDKAVVLVWIDWLIFYEYGFSVPALWCPLTTLTVLLGFLLPWTWGISSWLLQQSAAVAPYIGGGVSPHYRPSDLERGIAPLGPPVPAQPPLLGGGVAPPGHCPWPRMWGGSSRPFLCHHIMALSANAPDLWRGVTPLGLFLSGMCSSRLLPLTSVVGKLLSAVLSAPVAAAHAKCTSRSIILN